MTRKLAKIPYGQAAVRILPARISLISYATEAACIIGEWVYVNGLYSATTRRHLSAFAAEFCNTNYYTLKKCYEQRLKFNVRTGEFAERGRD